MSGLRCLCLVVYSCVQQISCCVVFCFPSSCVPHVASFSRLSPFFDCLFGILLVLTTRAWNNFTA